MGKSSINSYVKLPEGIWFSKKKWGLNLLEFWAFNMFQNVSKSSEQSGCALTEVTAKVAEGIRHFLKYTLW